MPNDLMTIGQVAAEAAVNIETIRYYQRIGLVGEPQRPNGGIRHYGLDTLQRVHFIKRAKALGFTLAETRELLDLQDGCNCQGVQALAEQKLARVQAKLADLTRMEQQLKAVIGDCQAGAGSGACALIESLQRPADILPGRQFVE